MWRKITGMPRNPRQSSREYGEQDDYGVDLARLRFNLKLSPAERLLRTRRAVESLLTLRAAFESARSARPR